MDRVALTLQALPKPNELEPQEIQTMLVGLSAYQVGLAASLPQPRELEVPDRLVSIEEAAQMLSLPVKTLRNRAATLPFARHEGRHWRFSVKGLQRYIARRYQ